jgi:hypothetical protein
MSSSLAGSALSATLASAAVLGDISVSGGGSSLTINSPGAISQVPGASISVGGLASFTSTGAAANGNISLNNNNNSFGSLDLTSANGSSVSVTEAGATALDTVAVNNGSLDVTSGGAITQVGAGTITVGGPAKFTSTGAGASGNITLNGNNNFGSLSVNSANGNLVSVTEADSTTFDDSSVGGNLTVDSGGPITQNAASTITVGGTATLGANAGGSSPQDITLNNAGNSFHDVIFTSAHDVIIQHVTVLPPKADHPGAVTGSVKVNDVSANLLNQAIANLSQVNIPLPKLDAISYSGAAISTDVAAQLLPPESVGTLSLQLPFSRSQQSLYKIEDISKWTSGRLAASGTTTGPQSPR